MPTCSKCSVEFERPKKPGRPSSLCPACLSERKVRLASRGPNLCKVCGKPVPPTGRKGYPPKTCPECITKKTEERLARAKSKLTAIVPSTTDIEKMAQAVAVQDLVESLGAQNVKDVLEFAESFGAVTNTCGNTVDSTPAEQVSSVASESRVVVPTEIYMPRRIVVQPVKQIVTIDLPSSDFWED